ncbi:hypothetical protein [Nonomuraea sp. NPDC023979]|uniref:hypothetical protein n=1 Tax=Nonomuraea sp. NPDC023979 TaxID=3154796 RepID=UPI0033C9C486
MSVPVPHPQSGDDIATLQRLQGRIKAINSLLAWQTRIAAEHERLACENASLRVQLDAAHHLIQSYQYALALDPDEAPPEQLVIAWHTGSEDCIPVAVQVDDTEWVVVVDGRPRVPNPVAEWHDWQRMKAIFRRINAQVAQLSTEGEQ